MSQVAHLPTSHPPPPAQPRQSQRRQLSLSMSSPALIIQINDDEGTASTMDRQRQREIDMRDASPATPPPYIRPTPSPPPIPSRQSSSHSIALPPLLTSPTSPSTEPLSSSPNSADCLLSPPPHHPHRRRPQADDDTKDGPSVSGRASPSELSTTSISRRPLGQSPDADPYDDTTEGGLGTGVEVSTGTQPVSGGASVEASSTLAPAVDSASSWPMGGGGKALVGPRFSTLTFSSTGQVMVPVVSTSNAPMAFGVWAHYLALSTAFLCLFFGPFSGLWWWYNTSPLYNRNISIATGVYSVVVGALLVVEETWGFPLLRGVGSFFDVMVSRYNVRSLLYIALSGFLFLSYPTVIPAVALLLTGAVNRVACARGESFEINLGKGGRRGTAAGKGEKKKPSLLRSAWRRVRGWLLGLYHLRAANRLGIAVWIVLYTGGNGVLFALTFLDWLRKVHDSRDGLDATPPVAEDQTLSYWIIPAKAFGLLLDLNCALILLPVCRTLIRWLYEQSTKDQAATTRILRAALALVPIDFHLHFHRLIGVVILLASVGHTFAHFVNFALRPDLTITILGGAWALISGGFLVLIMLLLYSSTFRRIRLAKFELFFEAHHLFVFFFVLLLVHGAHGQGPNFWRYFIGPAALYLLDRLLRFTRGKQRVELLSVQFMQDVMCLQFSKVGVFKKPFRCGQYLLLQCPAISPLQWHPFTISSAPSDSSVTVHIKISTDRPDSFTYRVAAYLSTMRKAQPPPRLSGEMAEEEQRELQQQRPAKLTPQSAGTGTMADPNFEFISFERIETDAEGFRRLPGRVVGPDGRPLFRVDGPHAAPTQHLTEYGVSLVVGAGIGSTPLAACLRQVVQHQWRRGMGDTFPSSAYFVWILRHDSILSFRWLIRLIRQTQAHIDALRAEGHMKGKHFEVHIYVSSPPRREDDRQRDIDTLQHEMRHHARRLTQCGSAGGSAMGMAQASADKRMSWGGQKRGQDGFSLDWDGYRLALLMTKPPLRSTDAAAKWPRDALVEEVEVDVGKDDVESAAAGDMKSRSGRSSGGLNGMVNAAAKGASLGDVRVYSGYAGWEDIFDSLAARHRGQRVGVMYCGAPAIAKVLREQCWMHNARKNAGTTHFQLHAENF